MSQTKRKYKRDFKICISNTSFPDERVLVLPISERDGRCGLKKLRMASLINIFNYLILLEDESLKVPPLLEVASEL